MSNPARKFIETRRDALRQVLALSASLAAPLKATGSAAEVAETGSAQAAPSFYRRILIPKGCHPALKFAAEIMACKLRLALGEIQSLSSDAVPKKGEIGLVAGAAGPRREKWFGPQAAPVKFDGYLIRFQDGAALVRGNRPRSLLYSAGDLALWRDNQGGLYRREPSFELRTSHGSHAKSIAEMVAMVGANLMQGVPAVATLKDTFPEVFNLLGHEEQERLLRAQSEAADHCKLLLQECRDADVPVYTSIYGNNFQRWSPALCGAADAEWLKRVTASPAIRGTRNYGFGTKNVSALSEARRREIGRSAGGPQRRAFDKAVNGLHAPEPSQTPGLPMGRRLFRPDPQLRRTSAGETRGRAIDHASKLLGDLHPYPKQATSDPGMSRSPACSRSLYVIEIGRRSRHPSTPPKEDSACRAP